MMHSRFGSVLLVIGGSLVVDLVQATREAWKKNDELRALNNAYRDEIRNLLVELYEAQEENVNLREIAGLPLD